MKPLFRWAGGKQRLVKQLEQLLPGDIKHCVYNEPFAGSAALALHLASTGNHGVPMYISDANPFVVNAFQRIGSNPYGVNEYLQKERRWYLQSPIATFQRNVATMQDCDDPLERAGAFIFVQQSSFNGLWRVNSKGRYNVPFGKRKTLNLPTLERLEEAARILAFAVFENNPAVRQMKLSAAISDAARLGFWYIDPPYVAMSDEHTRYTAADFGIDQHVELVKLINEMSNSTYDRFMISAADNPGTRAVYSGLQNRDKWWMSTLATHRSIAADSSKRGAITELVLTNYEPVRP